MNVKVNTIIAFVIILLIGFSTSKSYALSGSKKLTDKMLKNAYYTDVNFGRIRIKDGYINLSADKTDNSFRVELETIVKGKHNNDGKEYAVVLLASYNGGNHPDYTLSVMQESMGKAKEVDHVGLNVDGVDSIRIENSIIVVTIYVPNGKEQIRYKLQNNKLKEVE